MRNSNYSPVIILPGINHSQTYLNDSFGNPVRNAKNKTVGGTFIFPDPEAFKQHLGKLSGELLRCIVSGKPKNIEKAVYDAVSDSLWPQRCDNDGNFVNNLKTKRSDNSAATFSEEELRWLNVMVPMKELPDIIGYENIYFFTFNLVGDPMVTADELESYIKNVKNQTGSEKVTLLAVSLGGTILTAYLDKYGHKNIDKIVNAVACLDGTDIVADLLEKKFNTSDEFLYHTYIPTVLGETNGKKTDGYLLTSLLHILPGAVFRAMLNGAVDAALDTVMINCPQIWAMLPSYRYDAIAEKYLTCESKRILRKKTDRFQQARLNLRDNILAAVKDGVKVSFVSGSNLAFGYPEYSFFRIVASTGTCNTDGIINLSSTTLGATGAINGEKLSFGDKEPDGKYISPDGKIDVSTALLPDNTWIFINQHHEVGRNDAILNLFVALILGKIEDVNSDPVNYPGFNRSEYTEKIRRRLLPEAEKILSAADKGNNDFSQDIISRLSEAAEEGRQVLALTVADAERAKNTEDKLSEILINAGVIFAPKSPSEKDIRLENFSEKLSLFLLNNLGGGNLRDMIKRKIKR